MARFAGTIISEGTLNPRDLIPTFIGVVGDLHDVLVAGVERGRELESVAESIRITRILVDIEQRMRDIPDYFESMDSGWDLEQLFELLDELAPEGHYFGAHEGDGACFGFWPIGDDGDA